MYLICGFLQATDGKNIEEMFNQMKLIHSAFECLGVSRVFVNITYISQELSL